MEQFKYASIELEHEALSKEEVAERLLMAAKTAGYEMHENPLTASFRPSNTHFVVYSYGSHSGFFDHSGVCNPEHLTLEEFEEHCEKLKSQEVIGTIDEFHSKSCYDLYMYAVSLAKQVNTYIDKGWLVLHEGRPVRRFLFYSMDSPCVGEGAKNATYVWFGSSCDDEGKVWMRGLYTKKSIRKAFEEITIFNPAHAVKLKYNNK